MTDTKKTGLSNAMGDTKGVSLTPVITSLLKPTADMLGQELRDYVKDKLGEFKKAKRLETISMLLKSAEEQVRSSAPNKASESPNVAQADLFQNWVEGAQDIDPSEPLLAQMWRELLVDILKGNVPNKVLIEKLKLLDVHEAKFLLKTGRRDFIFPNGDEALYYSKRLEAVGLANRSYLPLVTVLLFALTPVMMGALDLLVGGVDMIWPFSRYFTKSYAIFLIFFALTLAVWGTQRSLIAWRLNWIGKALLKYAGKVGV